MRRFAIAIAFLAALTCLPHVAGAEDARPPSEVLEGLAGTWQFTSDKGTSRTVKRTLVLGGGFVQAEVTSSDGEPLNIKMYGYDATENVYRAWWFLPGRGRRQAGTMEFTGTWDEASKTITLKAEKQGFTLVNTMTFVDDKSHTMSITVTNAAGKVVNRTEGKLAKQE